jgi:protein TonB
MDNRVSADMSVDKEGFYNTTEILPGYPGGEKALGQFYDNNIQYPVDASDNGVDGTVKINFAVDENGKLYSPVVTSPVIGYGLEQEALRVFNKMPKWTPGRIKGKNVKTRFSLPIKFQLQ